MAKVEIAFLCEVIKMVTHALLVALLALFSGLSFQAYDQVSVVKKKQLVKYHSVIVFSSVYLESAPNWLTISAEKGKYELVNTTSSLFSNEKVSMFCCAYGFFPPF